MLSDGSLVTSNGHPVLDPGGQGITLNPGGPAVHIDEKGNVYQGQEQLGTIGVVEVADKKKLQKEGVNLFVGDDGKLPPTTPAADFSLNQGSVEMSNVEVVPEMVNMIAAHRNFEAYQKALQAMQDMDNKTANQVGRVA
jgi:flagellar basal-body rod protein FlgG